MQTGVAVKVRLMEVETLTNISRTTLRYATFFLAVAVSAPRCQAEDMCGETVSDVPAFMAALAAPGRPDRVSEDAMYITVRDRSKLILWTVTKPGHPAHPAVVCRKPAELDAEVFLHMNVSCGGPKSACDGLVSEFTALNEQASKAMRAAAEARGNKPAP